MTKENLRIYNLADFQLKLFHFIGDMMKNIASSLDKLAKSDPIEAIDKMSKLELAFESLYLTPVYIMPEGKPHFDEVYNYHGAFVVHHWDATNIIRHSMISCLSGIYGAAYSELRIALETFLNGAVYDCIAHPTFRKNTKKLVSIEGFQGAKSFEELLKLLGQKDLKKSASILDIIIENKIVPSASPSKLIVQLEDWQLINKKEAALLHKSLYNVSKYVHRTVPSYSDIGIRLEHEMNWVGVEPVYEEMIKFIKQLVIIAEVCSSLSLNIIGPSSAKFKKHLNKDHLNYLAKIYGELENVRMQDTILKILM